MKTPGRAFVYPMDKPRNDYASAWLKWEEYGYWYKQSAINVPLSEIEIPPPWNSGRLRDNLEWLEATGKIRPVQLSKDSRNAKYHISDGIHRCNAAKQMNYDAVPAVAYIQMNVPPPQAEGVDKLREQRAGWDMFHKLKDKYPLSSWDVKEQGDGFQIRAERDDEDEGLTWKGLTWKIEYTFRNGTFAGDVSGASSGKVSGNLDEASRQIANIMSMARRAVMKGKISKVAAWVRSICKIAGWISEFGPEWQIPKEILDLVNAGVLSDMSWHNDVCPSFGKEIAPDTFFQMFVEHPNLNERESPDGRFSASLVKPDGSVDYLLVTDNLSEVLTMARKYLKPKGSSAISLQTIEERLYDMQANREYSPEAQKLLEEFQKITGKTRPGFWQGPYPPRR